MAYKPPSENSFKRFSSVPLGDFIKFVPYVVPSSPIHTLALLMKHFTSQTQGQKNPPNIEHGSSVGDVPNPTAGVRSIKILDSEGELARICLPPCVSNDMKDIEKYTEYLSSLASFRVPLTFSTPNIPSSRGSIKSLTQLRSGLPAKRKGLAITGLEMFAFMRPPLSTG